MFGTEIFFGQRGYRLTPGVGTTWLEQINQNKIGPLDVKMDETLQVNAKPKLVERLRKESKARVESLKDFQDMSFNSNNWNGQSADSFYLKNTPNKVVFSNIETQSTTDRMQKMATYGGHTVCVKSETNLNKFHSDGNLTKPLLA